MFKALFRFSTRSSGGEEPAPKNVPMGSRARKMLVFTNTVRDAGTVTRGIGKGVRKIVPKAVQQSGDLVKKAGQATTPVAPPLGEALIVVGSTASTVGNIGIGLNQIYDGQYKQAKSTFGLESLSDIIDKALDMGEKKGIINKNEKTVIGLGTDAAMEKLEESKKKKEKK